MPHVLNVPLPEVTEPMTAAPRRRWLLAAAATATLWAGLPAAGAAAAPVGSVGGAATAPVATSTSVVADPASPVAGRSVTLTATVSTADGSAPQGQVQFADGSTPIGGRVAVDQGGQAAVSTALSAGTHDITAAFTPATSAEEASQGSLTLQVASPTPVTTVTAPSSPYTTKAALTAQWTAKPHTGRTVTSYAVRTQTATWSPASGTWSYGSTSDDTTQPSLSLTLAFGEEACVEVQATDSAGHTGPWTAPRCTTRFFDDRSLTAGARWHRATDRADYQKTITATTVHGASVALGLAATTDVQRVALLVTTCYDCGKVVVRSGSTVLGRVDLHSGTTAAQVVEVVTTPAPTQARVRVSVKSSNRPVLIDGIALTH